MVTFAGEVSHEVKTCSLFSEAGAERQDGVEDHDLQRDPSHPFGRKSP